MKTITQNYTANQTAQIISDYAKGVSLEQIALNIGKSVRSVIAKLSREGVYVAKSTTKPTRVTKANLISAIAVKFGVTDEALESLEKANFNTLEILACMKS
jgi:hypothetical protein